MTACGQELCEPYMVVGLLCREGEQEILYYGDENTELEGKTPRCGYLHVYICLGFQHFFSSSFHPPIDGARLSIALTTLIVWTILIVLTTLFYRSRPLKRRAPAYTPSTTFDIAARLLLLFISAKGHCVVVLPCSVHEPPMLQGSAGSGDARRTVSTTWRSIMPPCNVSVRTATESFIG